MPFVQTKPIQMLDNTANALVVREKVGGINYVEIDTLDGSEVIRLLPTGIGPVEFFGSSAEGVTQYVGISGYKTSGSLAEARLAVGVHTDEVLSIYNVSGYYFDTHVSIGKAEIEAWQASFTALQLGGNTSIMVDTAEGAGKAFYLMHNAYYDGAFKYISTDEATRYWSKGGIHTFDVVVSGTADTSISWTKIIEASVTGVGIGVTPAQKFEIGSNDNSESVVIFHSNSHLFIGQSKGAVYFINSETDTDNVIRVQGDGTGRGFIELYDQNNAEYLQMYVHNGDARILVTGSSPGSMLLNYNQAGDVRCFSSAAEGVTPYLGVSGRRTGGTRDEMQFAVGEHADQVGSIYGCANGYYVDARVGIGETSPQPEFKLHLKKQDVGGHPTWSTHDDLLIEGNFPIIQLLGAAGNSGSIGFSRAGGSAVRSIGYVSYSFAGDYMVFATDSTEAVRINSSQQVGIGVDPAQKFEIGSNDNASRISIYGDNTDFFILPGEGDLRIYQTAGGNVKYFDGAAEGETRYLGITGYKTSGTSDELRIAVGEHIDQTASFFGCARGYAFDTSVFLKEQAAALTDTADYGQTWVESTTPNRYMFTDDAGTDSVLNEVKGNFTMGVTGFTSSPSDTAYYTIRGNIVTLRIPAFSATSNSTDFTLTGLPAAIQPSIGGRLFIGVVDNGTPTYGKALFAASGTIQLAKESGNFGSGWTASGTKGTNGEFFVTYELAV